MVLLLIIINIINFWFYLIIDQKGSASRRSRLQWQCFWLPSVRFGLLAIAFSRATIWLLSVLCGPNQGLLFLLYYYWSCIDSWVYPSSLCSFTHPWYGLMRVDLLSKPRCQVWSLVLLSYRCNLCLRYWWCPLSIYKQGRHWHRRSAWYWTIAKLLNAS